METQAAAMILRDLQHGRTNGKRGLLLSVGLAVAILCFAASASAQVVPAAYQDMPRLWAGADYSNFSASFPYESNQRIWGIGVFADLTLKAHFGVAGDASFLHFGGFEASTESSYLAGPQYVFRNFGRFRPYVQGLVGVGKIHYPFQIGDASYFAVAPAAGVSYRLNSKFALRAAYEYQFWPNSPGYSNEPDHTLQPNGAMIGLAYSIFR
jgi:opacity protein-like surface antigen